MTPETRAVKNWSLIYADCPWCGWLHDTEGREQPIYCEGCHKPFTEQEVLDAE